MKRAAAIALVLSMPALAGCGGARGGRDASLPLTDRTAVLQVRIELPSSGAATASALGFRASSAGVPAGGVPALVDPLSAAAPGPGEGCQLRDADAAVRGLAASGGRVELGELPGLEIEILSAPGTILRPSARLFPDLGSVAGVVSEASPVEIAAAPSLVAVSSTEFDRAVFDLTVPEPARIGAIGGVGPSTGGSLPAFSPAANDLDVLVTGAEDAVLEIRPFGGTTAVACAVGAGGRTHIPHELLARAGGHAGSILSIDAIRRATTRVAMPGQPTTVSVEVRAASLLELRP